MRSAFPACLLLSIAMPASAEPLNAPAPDDIVVAASLYPGDVASGGARIDVAVRDLPLSITVLTDQLSQDRAIRNLRDLADNVAGVSPTPVGVPKAGRPPARGTDRCHAS